MINKSINSSIKGKNIQIVFSPWNNLLVKLISNSQHKIIIISPWIKEVAAKILIDSIDKNHKNNITLEVLSRLNSYDFAVNSSDIKAFELFFKEIPQFKLYSISNLHAKVYIFDSNKILITSGNFTTGGIYKNIEVGVLIQDEKICHNFELKLKQLVKLLDLVTIDNLTHISEIINKNTKLNIPILKNPDQKFPKLGETVAPSIFQLEDYHTERKKQNIKEKKVNSIDNNTNFITIFRNNPVLREMLINELKEYIKSDKNTKELTIIIGRRLYRILIRLKLPRHYIGLDYSYINPIMDYYSSDNQIHSTLIDSHIIQKKHTLKDGMIANQFLFIFGRLIIKNEFKIILNIFDQLYFNSSEERLEILASSGIPIQLLEEILQKHNKKVKIEYRDNSQTLINIYVDNKLHTSLFGKEKNELRVKATQKVLGNLGYLKEYEQTISQRKNNIRQTKLRDLQKVYKKQIPEWRRHRLSKFIDKYEIESTYLPLLNFAFTHKSWISHNKLSNIFSSERYSPIGYQIYDLYISTILSNYELFRKLKQEDYYQLVESILEHVINKFDFSSLILVGKQIKHPLKQHRVTQKTFLAFLYVYYLSGGLEKIFKLLSSLCKDEIDKILSEYKININSIERLEDELKQTPYLPEYNVLEFPSYSNHKLYKIGIYINEKKMGIGYGETYKIAQATAASTAIERVKYLIQ